MFLEIGWGFVIILQLECLKSGPKNWFSKDTDFGLFLRTGPKFEINDIMELKNSWNSFNR